jgi:hypothetical protein
MRATLEWRMAQAGAHLEMLAHSLMPQHFYLAPLEPSRLK